MKGSNSSAFTASESQASSPKDPRNLYSDTDYSKDSAEEKKSDLEFLENLEEFAKGFEAKDFDSENPNISEKSKMILGALPKKTQEYLEEIQKIKATIEKVAEVEDKDPEVQRKRVEERLADQQIAQQRVQQIAQELFIISCASNKPLEKSMDFHAKCGLGIKEFKDFGENGLSPLAATMISGQGSKEGQPSKAEEYLNKMKEAGLDEKEVMNVKSPSGMTALDIAVLTGNAEMAKLLFEKGGKLGLLEPKQQSPQNVTPEEASAELDQRAARFNRKRSRSSEGNSETSEGETKEVDTVKVAQDALRARELAESQIAIELSEKRIEKETKKQDKIDKVAQAQELAEYYEKKNKSKLGQESEVKIQESAEKSAKEKGEIGEKVKSPNAELAKILGISLSDSGAEISLDKLLFHAVDQNKNILAKIIVSLGGNPNHQENGVSVLSRAVERGDESLVSRLYASASPETRKISEVACGENPKMREVLGNLSRSESAVGVEEKRGEFRVSSASRDLAPKIPQAYEGSEMESRLGKVVEVSSKFIPPAPRPQSPIRAVSLSNPKALQVGG